VKPRPYGQQSRSLLALLAPVGSSLSLGVWSVPGGIQIHSIIRHGRRGAGV
jgi:hypothetical protein